jgi:1,4-alpha-glucan branching enzyme
VIEKRTGRQKSDVRVTFSIPAVWLDRQVAVVGDFNAWDPTATPLKKRGDVRTVTVTLRAGERYRFRYVDELGRWHDDPAADDVQASGFGSSNCIIDLTDADDSGTVRASHVRAAGRPDARPSPRPRGAQSRPPEGDAPRPSRRGRPS